ncbi:hypothetical protein J6590_036603 [Homalodisca vitripennis]|nr:hypothetical protein J6590_036603 [Homalodisca vitripennis]
MVRKYNRKTEKATSKVEDMMRAAQSLRRQENRLSLREAAAEFGVNYKALDFLKNLYLNNLLEDCATLLLDIHCVIEYLVMTKK